jgi:hypothetical protein
MARSFNGDPDSPQTRATMINTRTGIRKMSPARLTPVRDSILRVQKNTKRFLKKIFDENKLVRIGDLLDDADPLGHGP